MSDGAEGITTIRGNEILQLPPTEFRILQPFTTSDGCPICIWGPDNIQITNGEPLIEGALEIPGIFLPNNHLGQLSVENPLSVAIVPGVNFHMNAKNIALLSASKLDPRKVQEFADESRFLPPNQLNIAWLDFITRFGIEQFGENSKDFKILMDLLTDDSPSYEVGVNQFFAGTVSIIQDPFEVIQIRSKLFLTSRDKDFLIPDHEFARRTVSGLWEFVSTHRNVLKLNNDGVIQSPEIELNKEFI